VIKALLDHGVEARDIAILRYAIAAPGFLLVLARARGLPGLTRGDAVRVAAAGLLVVVGYHLCLNVGESHTTSGVAALIVALAPGLTLILSALVGLDAIGPRQVAGLTIAFAGVAVVVVAGTGESLSLESAEGPLIVLGAPLAFALYNVVLKPLLGRHDLLALTAASSLIGTVGLLPFVRTSTADGVVDVSAGDAARLLYLGLLATLVGYILWNAGLRGLGPTRAVSYTYAIPPLAVLLGAAVLDEPLSVYLGLGAVLVIGGIAVVQRRSRRGPEARLAQWRPEASAPSRSGS
jgi:drug/metabolite transporter (DMT)-like permease